MLGDQTGCFLTKAWARDDGTWSSVGETLMEWVVCGYGLRTEVRERERELSRMAPRFVVGES